jgi:hypothetical protein
MPEFPNEDLPPISPIQLASPEAGSNPDSPEAALDAQKALVTRHIERFSAWASWRKPMEGLWAEIYRLYVGVGKGTKVPTRAKVMIPIIFQVVETAVPKIMSIVFGMAEWFDVSADSGKLSDEQLSGVRKLLFKQLNTAKLFGKFVTFLKQLALYGTAYLQVYWKVRREWVWVPRPAEPLNIGGAPLNLGSLGVEKTLEYRVVERRPEIEVLPIENVFPDPDAVDVDQARGIYVVSFTTLEDLKAQAKGKYPVYTNIDKLEQDGGEAPAKQDFSTQRSSIRGISQPTEAGKVGKQIELLTYWGQEDLDGDGIPEEVQIVIANRCVLIKAIRNPFEHQRRPIITCHMFPVPHEPFGIGLVEPVIPLVHELTTIRNQNIDMNTLILNRMWKVSSLADVDLDTLVARPNGFIMTDQMDGIEPLPQPEIPYSPRELSALIMSDIENATAPKSIQGAPDNSSLGRTARGAQLIVGQALEKFGMAANIIEGQGVRPMLELMYLLNRQFLDEQEIIEEFYPTVAAVVSPDVLAQDVEFKLLGVNETVTKEAAMNQITSFLGMFKDVPGVDLLGVARAYWDRMGLNIRAEDVIAPTPVQGLGDPLMAEAGAAQDWPIAENSAPGAAAPQIPYGAPEPLEPLEPL